MKLVLNFRKGNARLREGIEAAGHEAWENIWDAEVFRKERVDAVVFEFKGIFKEKRRFLFLSYRLRKMGIPVITWNVDSPWNGGIEKWQVQALLRSTVLSLYASHSLQDTDGIRHARVIYLPNAAWASRYSLRSVSLHDLRNQNACRWDVSFIGNMDAARYPEHRKRAEFLDALGGILRREGRSFKFMDSRDLSFDEQVDVIQQSRVNLSCVSAADSRGGYSWGLSERCYGIPACGGFLLMEDRVHARDDFDVGNEVVTYTGIDDCVQKLGFFLERHDERRRIAENGHARVLRDHTYVNRAEKLISEIRTVRQDAVRTEKITHSRAS